MQKRKAGIKRYAVHAVNTGEEATEIKPLAQRSTGETT